MSLRLQINLLISVLLGLFASLLIGMQIDNTRRSVREEIEGANAVATQLLSRMGWVYANNGLQGVSGFLSQLGRVRANDIELYDQAGQLLYRSPPPTYKAGREAPAWYARLVASPLPPKTISLPGDGGPREAHLTLQADASRSVLDGWDDLQPLLWMVLAGLLLCELLVYALVGRVMRPQERLLRGLQRVAEGAYDTRLPVLASTEWKRVGEAFNRMAQSVQDSVEARRQAREAAQALAENRELTQWIQARIEHERGTIARELHDELGQQVTAIKSLALVIAKRSEGQDPASMQSARLVMDCADKIYDGMHRMVGRLRPIALDQFGLSDALQDLLADWRLQQPAVQFDLILEGGLDALSDAQSTAVYRVVQEAVSNALRHAKAERIAVHVSADPIVGRLTVQVQDDGVGRIEAFRQHDRFGLLGMRERAQALGGDLRLRQIEPQGVCVEFEIPLVDVKVAEST